MIPKNPFVITNQELDYSQNKIQKSLESQSPPSLSFLEYLPMIEILQDLQRKKNVKSFSTDYQNLCLAIGLNPNDRKIKMDSMFKKCKSKYCKAVQEALYCLLGDRSKVGKLPQAFITNINIKFNKKFLYYSLENLFREFGSIKYHSKLLVCNDERNVKIKALLSMTFIEGYKIYLQSDLFNLEINKLLLKKGTQIALMFYYSANLFIDYIMYSKGAKEKDRHTLSQSQSQIQLGSGQMSVSYETGLSDVLPYDIAMNKTIFKVIQDV